MRYGAEPEVRTDFSRRSNSRHEDGSEVGQEDERWGVEDRKATQKQHTTKSQRINAYHISPTVQLGKASPGHYR